MLRRQANAIPQMSPDGRLAVFPLCTLPMIKGIRVTRTSARLIEAVATVARLRRTLRQWIGALAPLI